MLWDYLNTVPTLIAIVNTVIAVGSSHFKPEQSRAKYALLVTSIVLGLTAAGATIAGQRHVLAVQAMRASHLATVREELGRDILTGNAVLTMLTDLNNQSALAAADAWATSVETDLRDSLGESYVSRFRDGNGLMYATPLGFASQERIPTFVGVSHRIERLTQFSSELSPEQLP